MLFDSHCHLQFPQFDDDREEVISRLEEAGIKVVNVGTNFEDSKKAVELAKKHPDLMWASVGLHPTDNSKEEFNIDKYRELAKLPNVVAIGECGLDYFRLTSEMEIARQKEIFAKQIELSKELNKPLILHCRPSAGSQDAYEYALEILLARRSFGEGGKYKNLNILSGNGVAHFFSGSKETVRKFLDLGFYIGFAGPITFVEEYRGAVKYVPLDKILVETDAPFAAPAPRRGRRNEPTYVEFVARKISEIKEIAFATVANQTAENAEKLFKIKL